MTKRPNLEVIFSPRMAPIGPSAPLLKARVAENPAVPWVIERAVYDVDLLAADAVTMLYGAEIPQATPLSSSLLACRE